MDNAYDPAARNTPSAAVVMVKVSSAGLIKGPPVPICQFQRGDRPLRIRGRAFASIMHRDSLFG